MAEQLEIPVVFAPKINRISQSELKAAFAGVGDAIENAGKGKMPLSTDDIKNLVSQINLEFGKLNLNELENEIVTIEKQLNSLDVSGIAENALKGFKDIDLSALEKAMDGLNVQELDQVAQRLQTMSDSMDDVRIGETLSKSFAKTKEELSDLLKRQEKQLDNWKMQGKEGASAYSKLTDEIEKTKQELEKVSKTTESLSLQSFGAKAFNFNNIQNAVGTVSDAFEEIINVGAEYQSTLAAVGAVTGLSGEKLNDLGAGARELAKQFGGSASDSLKSYQGILSKLGPQVAENAEALKSMGTTVNILSAASGDDAATSMNALVDTMLQLGLTTGDAAKDAETMTQVANALAASAKVGAAEIPQVAQSMLAVGVAAKGAKLDLVSTNAAIQLLAVGGKTGSEAGVALRNVLGLIQKASGPAELAMKGLGTSSKELGELLTTQGLDAALGKLKAGMDGLGSAAERNATLMTIFGTENSAAAGILLDNMDQFKEFEEGIRAGMGGAGDAVIQAAVRMDTATVKMAKLKATVQDAFIGAFDTIGDGVASVLGTAAQLGPTFTSLASIQTLIPDGAFEKVADGFKGITSQMGGISGLASKLGPTLMNPYVLGIGAATAALTYFFTQTEKGQEIWAELKETAEDLWSALRPLVEEGVEILGEYYGIFIDIGAAIFEYIIFPFEVAYEMFTAVLDLIMEMVSGTEGAGDATAGMLDALKGIKSFFTAIREAVQGFTQGFVLFKNVVIAFVSGSRDILSAFVEFATTAMNPANWIDGDLSAAQDKLSAAISGTLNVAVAKANNDVKKAKLGDALATSAAIQTDLDKNNKLGELVTKFQNAKTDVEKASIAKVIQEQVPGAVKSIGAVVDAAGNVTQQFEVSEEKVKSYAAAQEQALGTKSQKAAQQVAEGIQASATAYTAAQEQAKKLQDEIINAAKTGKDTSSLETRYKAVLDKVSEEGKKVSDSISKSAELNIPLTGINLPPEFEAQVSQQMEGVAAKLREKRIGEQLKSSIEIQGSLDKQNEIGKLVDQYKAASTEAEKSDIAARIRANMPGAVQEIVKGVDANGNLIKSLKVNTGEVEKNVEANKKRFTGDLAAKQKEFQKSISDEGKLYQTNISTLRDLAEQIKTSSNPAETEKLKAQFAELQKKVGGSKDEVIAMAQQTTKFGATAEDVYTTVANSLGISVGEAKELVKSTTDVGAEAANAAKAVQDMAKAFTDAKTKASEMLDTTKSQYNGLLLEFEQTKKNKALSEEERKSRLASLQEQMKQLRAAGKEQVNEVKLLDKLNKQTEDIFATDQKKGKEQKSLFEVGKAKLDNEVKSSSLAQEQLKTDQERIAIAEKRSRNTFDELTLESRRLTNLQDQRASLKQLFGDLVAIDEKGNISINVSSKLFKDGEEKAQLSDLVADLNNDIAKSQNSLDSLRVKLNVDSEELARSLREQRIKQLEVDIELGIKTKADLMPILDEHLNEIYAAREKNYNDIVKLEEEFEQRRLNLGAGASAEQVEALEQEYKVKRLIVDKESSDLYKKEIDAKEDLRKILKRIDDNIVGDIQDAVKKKTDAINKQYDEEEQRTQALINLQRDARKQILNDDKTSVLDQVKTEEESRLKEIDRLRKLEVLTEESAAENKLRIQQEYQAKREKLEDEHRKRLQVVDNLAAGAERFRKFEQNKQLLEIEIQGKADELKVSEDQIAILEKNGLDTTLERQKAAKLASELDELKNVYSTKGSQIAVLTEELTVTINDTLGNLGNSEAVADSFRKLFATIAGALQAQLTGFVMSLVLSPSVSSYLAALPFPANVIALPTVTALINTTVRKLTNPLLESLLSFPTGGRVDTPTMFVAGDGARLGESNREWIFRDSQLKLVMAQTAGMANAGLLESLNRIEKAILSLDLTFTGRDMKVAVDKATFDYETRSR